MSAKRGARMTPAQMAAQGIVEGPDGRWRKVTTATPAEHAAVIAQAIAAPAPKGRGNRPFYPYRNTMEKDAAGVLARTQPWLSWKYESLVCYLPDTDGRLSEYRPDFPGWDGATVKMVVEVKGSHRWRRQGIDRLRAAVAKYPEFEWYLMEKEKGEWSIKRVEG